jgi:hypothetical protein
MSDDIQCSKDWVPHPTHEMTEWESAIVTLLETSRFGSIRECKNCGAEEAQTSAGHRAHTELAYRCLAASRQATGVSAVGGDQ